MYRADPIVGCFAFFLGYRKSVTKKLNDSAGISNSKQSKVAIFICVCVVILFFLQLLIVVVILFVCVVVLVCGLFMHAAVNV